MKIYELLIEAAYDGMITAIKTQLPDQIQYIDQNIQWAKQYLKKQDRIVWYLKILKAFLLDQLTPQILGTYKFESMEKLQQVILHFYGFNDPKIEQYQYQSQSIGQVILDLHALENIWKQKQETNRGVKQQPGDYELFKFNDGTAWWFVNRAYCPDEGRSGQHCGNVVGRHKTNQRILSLRNSADQVILTFILEPDGTLGEMKAKGNQKPQEEFHPQIMKLLMWDKIKGISGQGYLPDANFSIFDLNDNNLNYIEKNKPQLIQDQIEITPIEILKSPDWIKQKYGKSANIPQELIFNPSLETWVKVTDKNPKLVIYAPHDMPDFKEKLLRMAADRNSGADFFLKCPKSITKNNELVKDILNVNGRLIAGIPPTNKNYNELCKIAVSQYFDALDYVPEELRTPELCKIAVSQTGRALDFVPGKLHTPELYKFAVSNNGDALGYVPEELHTPELYKIAVSQDGLALKYVPRELRTPELCKIAVSQDSSALDYVPQELHTPELYKIAVSQNGKILDDVPKELRTPELCKIAVSNNGWTLQHVPYELRTPELCKIAVSQNGGRLDFVPVKLRTPELFKIAVSQDGEILDVVPEELRTPELCKIAVSQDGGRLGSVPGKLRTFELCKIAVSNNGLALQYVPYELRTPELYKIAVSNNGYALAILPEELLTPDLCKIAVSQDSRALQYVPRELRTPDLCKIAVSQNGYALDFVPKELRTPELIKIANQNR